MLVLQKVGTLSWTALGSSLNTESPTLRRKSKGADVKSVCDSRLFSHCVQHERAELAIQIKKLICKYIYNMLLIHIFKYDFTI